jgi:outer membrane protein assembly factor BamA
MRDRFMALNSRNKQMAKNKQELEKIIKEEVQRVLDEGPFPDVDPDLTEQVIMIAVNEGNLYQSYKMGRITPERVIKKAANIYYKTKMEQLREELFSKSQFKDMVKAYKDYYKEQEKDWDF